MQEKKEKSPDLSDFSFEEGSGGLVAVLLVVSVAFNHPIPGFQGFLATRQVLLRHERSLILGDAHQIRFTGLDRSGYCGEACANCELLAGRLRTALHFSTEVQTVTVFRLGCCYTVGTEEHFFAGVLTALARFGQCSGYGVDTGTPFYFCHKCSAFAEQTALWAERPLTL